MPRVRQLRRSTRANKSDEVSPRCRAEGVLVERSPRVDSGAAVVPSRWTQAGGAGSVLQGLREASL